MQKTRNLSDTERLLLDKLAKAHFIGQQQVVEQIKTCKAVDTDDPDNYGSIKLVTSSTIKIPSTIRVPVEAYFEDSDGVRIEVLLHLLNGFVDELEIYKVDGSPIKNKIEPDKLKVQVNTD